MKKVRSISSFKLDMNVNAEMTKWKKFEKIDFLIK